MDGSRAKVFESAQAFEAALCEAASQGALVLAARPRLARRLLHRYRNGMRAEGRTRAWETAPIQSFGAWVRRLYEGLWRPDRPLDRLASLAIWERAVREVPPPDGLEPTPLLFSQLQKTLDLLEAQELTEEAGAALQAPLTRWRRAAGGRFLRLAEQEALVSWHRVLAGVAAAVESGEAPIPARVVLAGFDEPTPSESRFFERVGGAADLVQWRVARKAAGPGAVRVYASPEQECRDVCGRILSAWNRGERNLGLVFLDPEYLPRLRQYLAELAGLGERPDLEREIRYNLAVGIPLSEHPLFQWALLPLRVIESPRPLPLLASMAASAYATRFGVDRTAGVLRPLFRRNGPLSLPEICRALDHGPLQALAEGFRGTAPGRRAPLAQWLSLLKRIWDALGFSEFGTAGADEDISAKRHLDEIVEGLGREAGTFEVEAAGLLGWFGAASEGLRVARRSVETAGIQVLGAPEACGLAFDRLWVVGAHGGVLPRSPDPLPFIDPAHRQMIPEGTAEGRWESAARLLDALRAGSPEPEFSRAVSAGEDAPYLPCPLMADEEKESGPLTLDLWRCPSPEWLRAAWLRGGIDGLSQTAESGRAGGETPLESLAGRWSVTRLQHLTACPYRFFAGDMLKLEPLEEPDPGLDPATRGSLVHKALRLFVENLGNHAPSWPDDQGKALAWLVRCVDRTLAELPDAPPRRAERTRLLGEGSSGGILGDWLERERDRARRGWRFAGAETGFSGLEFGPVTLTGRMDRIDAGERDELAVWDYKTGAAPSSAEVMEEMTDLQVPAYLLALRKGAVEGFDASGMLLSGGYISLKKAGEVRVRPLKPEQGWNAFLDGWEAALSRRLGPASEGAFPPEPKPSPGNAFRGRGGACRYCDFFNLCGYFDEPSGPNGQPDESEEGE